MANKSTLYMPNETLSAIDNDGYDLLRKHGLYEGENPKTYKESAVLGKELKKKGYELQWQRSQTDEYIFVQFGLFKGKKLIDKSAGVKFAFKNGEKKDGNENTDKN